MTQQMETQAELSVDVTEVGNKNDRQALLACISELFHSSVDVVDFWGDFPDRAYRVRERMLVVADLGKICKRYRSRGYHEWLTSVRKAQPYFLALVRTKRDEHYADLVDDLMRHSDLRITVCRDTNKSAFRKCLWEAVSVLDPEAIIDVRYAPSTEGLWVVFSDGLSGRIDFESLGMTDLLDELRLDSATVGRRGATVEILTRDGDSFEIDALSIRALLDADVATSIARRAAASDKSVGERIRSARQAAGVTQTELGERIRIDQAIISKLERGKHQPRFDTLRRIAEGLGLSVSELLTREVDVQ